MPRMAGERRPLRPFLRSAANGDAALINERQRLTSQQPPHIVLRDGAGPIVFQHGAWSRSMPEIVVFDDRFVSENVCSGVEIEAGHRQNLHELILGAQGVSLNAAVQDKVAAIEAHNKQLKSLGDAIPAAARGRHTVDAFCALEVRPDIDRTIQEAERGLAAARSADTVRTHALFLPIGLPALDAQGINEILERHFSDLESDAAAKVQAHLKRIGKGGEAWVADGMPRIEGASVDSWEKTCPFCAQDLAGSLLIEQY